MWPGLPKMLKLKKEYMLTQYWKPVVLNDPIDDHLVNAKIVWKGKKIMLVSSSEIAEGDEIFLSYSDEYWINRLHYLPLDLRERIEDRLQSERSNDTRPCINFDEDVEVAFISAEDTIEKLIPEIIPEPLRHVPENILTRMKKNSAEVSLKSTEEE